MTTKTTFLCVLAILVVATSGRTLFALTPEEATQVAIEELKRQGINANAEQIRAAMRKVESKSPRTADAIKRAFRNASSAEELRSVIARAPKYDSRARAVAYWLQANKFEADFRTKILDAIQAGELDVLQRAVAYRVLGDLETESVILGKGDKVRPPSSSWLDRVSLVLENSVRIRDDSKQINGPPVADDPAKLAWVKPRGENAYYTIDAAILWTPAFLDWDWKKFDDEQRAPSDLQLSTWEFAGRIRPSFEAHVSTQTGANRNQLTYGVPFEGKAFRFPGTPQRAGGEIVDGPLFTGHSVALTPTYVTDRSASLRTWGVDLDYEPSMPALHLNGDGPSPVFGYKQFLVGTTARAGFTWRSIEAGTGALSTGMDYSQFRAEAGIKAILVERLTLTGKYVGLTNLSGEGENHTFLEMSAELMLDKREHFTVGVSYFKGEEEPTYEKVDTFTAWVGVKF
jgi:hypothetical protein